MLSLNDDHHAHGFQCFLYALHNLLRHAFLHLQTPCEDLHDACYFRQSGDCSVGDVSHVDFSEERQHVVFAHRMECYVFHDDHVVVLFVEDCFLKNRLRVLQVAFCEILHGFRHTQGCQLQPFTFGVFSEQFENVSIVFREFVEALADVCFFFDHDSILALPLVLHAYCAFDETRLRISHRLHLL